MTDYLLIESRDPFDSGDCAQFLELAEGLSRAGHAVTLFLVENGVLPAREGARAGRLPALAANGVAVYADAFALQERGISPNRLSAGIKPAPLDVVIDCLTQGAKALWH